MFITSYSVIPILGIFPKKIILNIRKAIEMFIFLTFKILKKTGHNIIAQQ